ncbi:hypothetical protein D3C73_1413500 [compost metagenome]
MTGVIEAFYSRFELSNDPLAAVFILIIIHKNDKVISADMAQESLQLQCRMLQYFSCRLNHPVTFFKSV